MVMVGYAVESPTGSYRFYNPKTKRTISSDSVTWSDFKRWVISEELSGIYEEAKSMNKPVIPSYDEEGILIDEGIPDLVENTASGNAQKQQQQPQHGMVTRSRSKAKEKGTRGTVSVSVATKEPKRPTMTDGKRKVTGNTRVKLINLDNGIAVLEEEKREDRTLINQALFIFNTSLNSDPGEPKTDKQALEGPESDWWFPACVAEINNFLDRGSWKFVKRSLVAEQRRKLIGTKMVYKKKDEPDGTIRYKTRCVSKGFTQIPGVDFTEKFSPVATDTSIRIVIALILYFWDSHGSRAKGIDIEAAFLEGDLNKKYYLDPPNILVELGFMTYEEWEEYCIELQKGMYGQVDTALRFFIKFTGHLESAD